MRARARSNRDRSASSSRKPLTRASLPGWRLTFRGVARGYRDWGPPLAVLRSPSSARRPPLAVLRSALADTRDELAGRGITDYRPDGRKRLRGVR